MLPAAAYLWFIQYFGVNVPRQDQWSDIALIGRSYSGTLGFGDLWAGHNDHRILFPNLLAVALGRTTHLNLFVEMYLSAFLLFVAIGLIAATHRRRAPSTPLIAYCPVAIVLLSLAQYQDTLWGFQIAWYIVVVCLAATLFLLDRPTLHWPALAGAIAVAVVGSYSLFQGLLIWPVGLLLMSQRRRARSQRIAWAVIALVTAALYFVHLASPPDRFYVLHHPGTAIKLFFLTVGDIFAQPTPFSGDNVILVFGVLMTLVAAWVVARYGLRPDPTTGRPVGVALICFGLLFVASADIGTAYVFGAWVGTNSLYVINVLMIPIGIYLVVLGNPVPNRAFRHAPAGRPRRRHRRRRHRRGPVSAGGIGHGQRHLGGEKHAACGFAGGGCAGQHRRGDERRGEIGLRLSSDRVPAGIAGRGRRGVREGRCPPSGSLSPGRTGSRFSPPARLPSIARTVYWSRPNHLYSSRAVRPRSKEPRDETCETCCA